MKAACGLQTAKFNSSYVNVTMGQVYLASLCGHNAFNISFSYSIGCTVPSPYMYHPYGVPTKDLVMMQVSSLSIVSPNATFDACLENYLSLYTPVLFSNPGNSTSGAVQCVPRTLSPTPPTTFSPTPPTTMNPTYSPTVLPTFSPTTAAQNALAVDFRSVPSPLVFESDPYSNQESSLIYGAFQTTLLTCTPSAATPACMACDDPAFWNVTYSAHDYQCVSHARLERANHAPHRYYVYAYCSLVTLSETTPRQWTGLFATYTYNPICTSTPGATLSTLLDFTYRIGCSFSGSGSNEFVDPNVAVVIERGTLVVNSTVPSYASCVMSNLYSAASVFDGVYQTTFYDATSQPVICSASQVTSAPTPTPPPAPFASPTFSPTTAHSARFAVDFRNVPNPIIINEPYSNGIQCAYSLSLSCINNLA